MNAFAVFMIDVDHFKAINDCYGHGIGDKVLCAVADALRRHLRETDMTCRYGGEEFLVIARGISHDQQALDIADKLRHVIEQLRIEPQLGVTVSIGITLSGGGNASSLIDLADRALYQAKRQGRNTVSLYADSEELPRAPMRRGGHVTGLIRTAYATHTQPETAVRLCRERSGAWRAPDLILAFVGGKACARCRCSPPCRRASAMCR